MKTVAKVENKEMKVQVVLGTKVVAGEVQEFYTAKCECGCRTIIAGKESSLVNFLKNVKSAKCCGSEVKIVGLKKFKDGKMVTLKSVKKTAKVEPTGLVNAGRKGISNKQMIPAIIENIENEANLQILFDTYGETFISAAKYTPDKMKIVLQALINKKNPEVKLPIGKKLAC